MQDFLDNIFGFSELGISQSKSIPKNQFYEQDSFNTAKKKMFTDEIDKITLVAICDSKTTNMESVVSEDERYEEIFFIKLELKQVGKELKIAEVIHQTIPNPVVLIFTHEDSILISIAPKRLSKQEHGKVVVQKRYDSPWIKVVKPSELDQQVAQHLHLKNMRFDNLKMFYLDIAKVVVQADLTEFTERFISAKQQSLIELDALSDKIKKAKDTLSSLQNQEKQMKNFGDKVTNRQNILNTQKQLDTLKQELLALDANANKTLWTN